MMPTTAIATPAAAPDYVARTAPRCELLCGGSAVTTIAGVGLCARCRDRLRAIATDAGVTMPANSRLPGPPRTARISRRKCGRLERPVQRVQREQQAPPAPRPSPAARRCALASCGQPVPPSQGTKPRRFCSKVCAYHAWELAHPERRQARVARQRERRREQRARRAAA